MLIKGHVVKRRNNNVELLCLLSTNLFLYKPQEVQRRFAVEGLVLLAFIFDLHTTTTAGSVRVNSEANAVYCAPSIIIDWNIQPLATPSQPEIYFESYNWEQSLNADATDMKRHVTENWWMKITKKKITKTKKKHLLGSLETGDIQGVSILCLLK